MFTSIWERSSSVRSAEHHANDRSINSIILAAAAVVALHLYFSAFVSCYTTSRAYRLPCGCGEAGGAA